MPENNFVKKPKGAMNIEGESANLNDFTTRNWNTTQQTNRMGSIQTNLNRRQRSIETLNSQPPSANNSRTNSKSDLSNDNKVVLKESFYNVVDRNHKYERKSDPLERGLSNENSKDEQSKLCVKAARELSKRNIKKAPMQSINRPHSTAN